MDVIVFEVCRKRYAVEITAAVEVIPLGPVTPVPVAPPELAGAMNVRGQVCPVIRLDGMLSSVPDAWRPDSVVQPGKTGLLVQSGDCRAVLTTDKIQQVARIQRAQMISSGCPTDLQSCILETEIGILHLINFDLVLRRLTDRITELTT